MLHIVARLVRWIHRLTDGLAELSVISLIALTTMVTIGVLMRYAFNSALTWADEMSSYFLLGLVLFSLAHTLKAGSHIRIEYFVHRVPPRARQYLQLVAYACALLFAVLFILACWARWENFWFRNTTSFTDLRTPLYIPASALLTGSVAFLLIIVARAMELLAVMFIPDATTRYGFDRPPGEEPAP